MNQLHQVRMSSNTQDNDASLKLSSIDKVRRENAILTPEVNIPTNKRKQHQEESSQRITQEQDIPISTNNADDMVSEFKAYNHNDIKINHCGIYSSLTGKIYGTSKEGIIVHYKELLRSALNSHYQKHYAQVPDKKCEISIIVEAISLVTDKQSVTSIIDCGVNHIILGNGIYSMNISLPPKLICRLKYPIRFNVDRSLDLSIDLAENNKFKYSVICSGSVSLWNIPMEIVMRTYQSCPDRISNGTVQNDPPDSITSTNATSTNADKILEKTHSRSESLMCGKTVKDLSTEQKIIGRIFNQRK